MNDKDNPLDKADPELVALLAEIAANIMALAAQNRALVNLLIEKKVFSTDEHTAALAVAIQAERADHYRGFREYLDTEAAEELKNRRKQ